MIRRWVEAQGGVDTRVSIAVLAVVTAFFLWTVWRVYRPKNRGHFDRIASSLLDIGSQGEQQ